ncbi:MAG: ABC transporter ATP-binding protein [Acetobacteraceae bacterium]
MTAMRILSGGWMGEARSAPEPGIETHPLRVILRTVGRHKAAHIGIFIFVLCAVAAAIGSQYAVKMLIDVLARHQTAVAWTAFAALAGLIAVDNCSWRAAGWIAARSFVAVTGDLRRLLFDHLLGHAPGYFTDRHPGALAGRISATGNAVFRIESLVTWTVLPSALAVLLSIVTLGTVDPLMGVALVGVAAALGGVIVWIARAGRPLHEAYASAAAKLDGELVDVINNAGVVRAFGANLREQRHFAAGVEQEMTARRISLRYLEKLRMLHAFSTALLTAGLLAWTLHRFDLGLASPGDVVLVTTLGFTVLHGTRDLAVALVQMVQDWARFAEALSALLVPHELNPARASGPLATPRGAITLADVEFGYRNGPSVLRQVSLAVRPGERVGLVGRSGSGKTTLLALLQRQYDPRAGRVLIDGTDAATIPEERLAAILSVVSQDVQLFHRSVWDNIRYGRPEASKEEVCAAAQAAEAEAFIAALPDGYDTIVGERGMKLSGGQRQRLAIARAFLCDARILLLDEATSSLDSESEAGVQQALDRLVAGRTVIAAAHRLSTLRDFDRIIVLEDGRVVDQGTPIELALRPGPYRDLLELQNLVPFERAA